MASLTSPMPSRPAPGNHQAAAASVSKLNLAGLENSSQPVNNNSPSQTNPSPMIRKDGQPKPQWVPQSMSISTPSGPEPHEREVFERLINHLNAKVVREGVRSQASKTLLGDDEHTIFVLNHCLTGLARQKDKFRYKQHLFSLLSRRDLDSMGDLILQKASYRLMDYLVEKRIETMPGQRLVNILGRHERLGFMAQDIDEEDEDDDPQPPEPQSTVMGLKPECPTCKALCADQAALEHHLHRQICKNLFDKGIHKAVCPRCWQPFKQPKALQYHEDNKVCTYGVVNTPTENSLGPNPQPQAAAAAKRNKSTFTLGAAAPNGAAKGAHTQGAAASKAAPSAQTGAPHSKLPYDPNDPEGLLTLEQRQQMNDDMETARIKYGNRMREVEEGPESEANKVRLLSNLRNSFYTRQSIIRLKYGIRLKSARRKEFLEWERSNMNMSPLAISVAGSAFKKLRTSMGGDSLATNYSEYEQDDEGEEPVHKTPSTTTAPEMVGNGLLPASNVPVSMVDPTVSSAEQSESDPMGQRFGSGMSASPDNVNGAMEGAENFMGMTPVHSNGEAVLVAGSGDDTDCDDDGDIPGN